MAAFGVGINRRLSGSGRGPSAGFRFTLYAGLSILIMFLDQRGGWLVQTRYLLQAVSYPLQLAVNSPSAAWTWVQDSFETRESLQAENARLRLREHALSVRSLRYEALERENAQLRGLAAALPPLAERWLIAEVVNTELNSVRQRLVLNRGTRNSVFSGQAVLDDAGLIGQTTHIGPWSADVILITDPAHAVPVQIERTGLRTLAVGVGSTGVLALPYLPANADIKPGDQLVTSGLGGVFPAGYPVARVAEVHRDAVQPLAQVRATPLARIDRDREVMLIWFRETHPAAPASSRAGDLKTGEPAIQPRSVPPPPAPTIAPAAAPASAEATPGDAAKAAKTAAPTPAKPAPEEEPVE